MTATIINRLNCAETENVNGGHFHAWKNLHNAVRSKMTQKIAAAGLLVGMSVSLVGCFANGNNNESIVPTNAPVSYGQVIGSGEKVATPTGTYEKIAIDATSPIYQYNNGEGHPAVMTEAGWTTEDGQVGQKLIADYMVKEFVDSSALEGGDPAFREWHTTTAKSYYEGNVYEQVAANPAQSNVILGNFGGNNSLPEGFIHDGSPREKSLDMKVTGFLPFDNGADKGIEYSVEYTAEYRVDDANAAKFAGLHAGMTAEQFAASPKARSNLKDGTGENIYRAKGTANIIVGKNANNEWKIIGFRSQTDFDTSDFTQ